MSNSLPTSTSSKLERRLPGIRRESLNPRKGLTENIIDLLARPVSRNLPRPPGIQLVRVGLWDGAAISAVSALPASAII